MYCILYHILGFFPLRHSEANSETGTRVVLSNKRVAENPIVIISIFFFKLSDFFELIGYNKKNLESGLIFISEALQAH